jgi:hypothetical protein
MTKNGKRADLLYLKSGFVFDCEVKETYKVLIRNGEKVRV